MHPNIFYILYLYSHHLNLNKNELYLRFFVYGLCYLIKFPYLANLYQLALRNTSLTNTNLYYD
mgnify:CR=1 FL=1